MIVNDLIKELQKFDGNLQVWFDYHATECSVELEKDYDGNNIVLLW